MIERKLLLLSRMTQQFRDPCAVFINARFITVSSFHLLFFSFFLYFFFFFFFCNGRKQFVKQIRATKWARYASVPAVKTSKCQNVKTAINCEPRIFIFGNLFFFFLLFSPFFSPRPRACSRESNGRRLLISPVVLFKCRACIERCPCRQFLQLHAIYL